MSNETLLILRPIEQKSRAFYQVLLVAACGSVIWLYYVMRLLIHGHVINGTVSYGATWGITVANIVHVIGISHVGIAISATVRVLRLERYRNVARLAEFVTLTALMTAVINIGMDVGRPDRFIINTVLYGRWHAPMVWSMTVITLYLLGSCAYLYLTMRRDFWLMSRLASRGRRIYRALALGYEDTEEERRRHDHTLFWVAICLVPIMISVHSVYGLFFGLLPGRGGWTNPLQAPYFVLGAIVSGFSAILVICAVLRWVYGWEELFPDRVFKVFGIFLAFVVFLYLYFLIAEQLTAMYADLHAEHGVASSLLAGNFSPIFWTATLVGLVAPFVFLFVQAVKTNYTSVPLTAAAAALINLAMLAKRYLIVVPAQYHPHLPLPRPLVPYHPTASEMILTFGSYAFAALVFIALLGVVPIVEMPVDEDPVPAGHRRSRSRTRGVVMTLTLLAAVAMIAWGIGTRQYDYAPVKWLIGLAMLVAIPLERCLINDEPTEEPVETAPDFAQQDLVRETTR